LNHYIQAGYLQMESDGCIYDPVIETGLMLAVLSLVPFSFVRRTRKGQVTYKKIRSALWKYEWQRQRDDIEVNLTFETARIARALKAALVAAYHQASKGEGEDPS
jgi:hypothetical protein